MVVLYSTIHRYDYRDLGCVIVRGNRIQAKQWTYVSWNLKTSWGLTLNSHVFQIDDGNGMTKEATTEDLVKLVEELARIH